MKRFLLVVIFAGLAVVGGSAAVAQTWLATTDGSSVEFNNNTNQSGTNIERFHVCDTDADGNGVYVDWRFNGTTGDERWAGGNGTCHNFDHTWAENKDVDFRSCEEINLWPDDCSDWKDAES